MSENKSNNPQGNSSQESDRLNTFLLIYAVSFTIGLIRAIDAILIKPQHAVVIAALSLIFIGLRFIFSPIALDEYLVLRKVKNDSIDGTWVVLIHYIVLLTQASLIYAACSQLKNSGLVELVVFLAIIALLLNAVWLGSMLYWARNNKNSSIGDLKGCPLFWCINNISFVILSTLCVTLSTFEPLMLACYLLLMNSIIDLWFTADWYLFRKK